MELITTIALVAMSASLVLWRRAEGELYKTRDKLIAARLVAEAGAHSTKVLAKKIKERERTIANLEIYISEIAGTDGLVDLLNGGMLSDGQGGDDPSGMSN